MTHHARAELATIEIVNPGEADWKKNLFLMWFDQHSPKQLLVWADGFDDAFEEAVDFLDDPKTCGFFSVVDEGDMRAAAKNLNIDWPTNAEWDDLPERDQSKIYDAATVDFTVIGHTQIHCMRDKPGIVGMPSWEWGGDDITGDDKKFIRAASMATEAEAELTEGGWDSKAGTVGVWTVELDVPDKDYDVVLYDQRWVFHNEGGDGKKLKVEVYERGGTAPIKTEKFERVRDADIWVDEVADELKWADDE